MGAAERRERYSHTLDGSGYIVGGVRPPTRLISNWRAKTSRIRLHKERRGTVQDSFMIGD